MLRHPGHSPGSCKMQAGDSPDLPQSRPSGGRLGKADRGRSHALSTGYSALLCRTSSVQGTECQPPGSRCLLAFVPEHDGWRFAVFALFGFLRVYQFSGSAPSPRPLTHPVCDRRVFLSRASEETSFSSTPTSFSRVRSTLITLHRLSGRPESSSGRVLLSKAERNGASSG